MSDVQDNFELDADECECDVCADPMPSIYGSICAGCEALSHFERRLLWQFNFLNSELIRYRLSVEDQSEKMIAAIAKTRDRK